MAMKITGSCHCSTIRYTLVTDNPTQWFRPRDYQCTFCIKHGATWISDPAAALAIEIATPLLVQRYVFGHGTAEFLLCRRCGVVCAAVCDMDGALYAVLNANTAVDPGAFPEAAQPVRFDGEDKAQRLARRKETWIGRVAIRP